MKYEVTGHHSIGYFVYGWTQDESIIHLGDEKGYLNRRKAKRLANRANKGLVACVYPNRHWEAF